MPYDRTQPAYITQNLGGIAEEGVDGRFDREYKHMGKKIQPEDLLAGDDRYNGFKPYAGATARNDDDRKERQLDRQSNERQSRRFSDPETGVSETGKEHAQHEILVRIAQAKDRNDPNYPTDEEINDAFKVSAENTNKPQF